MCVIYIYIVYSGPVIDKCTRRSGRQMRLDCLHFMPLPAHRAQLLTTADIRKWLRRSNRPMRDEGKGYLGEPSGINPRVLQFDLNTLARAHTLSMQDLP